jgi:hypothetical protein
MEMLSVDVSGSDTAGRIAVAGSGAAEIPEAAFSLPSDGSGNSRRLLPSSGVLEVWEAEAEDSAFGFVCFTSDMSTILYGPFGTGGSSGSWDFSRW